MSSAGKSLSDSMIHGDSAQGWALPLPGGLPPPGRHSHSTVKPLARLLGEIVDIRIASSIDTVGEADESARLVRIADRPLSARPNRPPAGRVSAT